MIQSEQLLQSHNKDIFVNWLFESMPESLKIQYIGIYELTVALDEEPDRKRSEIFEEFSEKYYKSPDAIKHWYYRYIKPL